MLMHLAGTASASHAYVFDCPAKTCHLMTFKMVEGNKYIRIHYRTSYICFLAVFTVRHGDNYIIRSPQSVCYDYLAACSYGIKAVYICTV